VNTDGKIGKDLTPEGYDAAHHIALSLMATLNAALFNLILHLLMKFFYCIDELGDLDKVKRIVKLVGFVNCVDGFTGQPGVINGASDTFAKVFGEKGIPCLFSCWYECITIVRCRRNEAIVEIEE
jgi:hypothetical protein